MKIDILRYIFETVLDKHTGFVGLGIFSLSFFYGGENMVVVVVVVMVSPLGWRGEGNKSSENRSRRGGVGGIG